MKTNYTYVLKLLFAAIEVMRKFDQGKGFFLSRPNQFYSEYVKDNSNRPIPTLV